MKNTFVSSRLNSLTITICYFAMGVIWSLYGNKLFVLFTPHQKITAHNSSDPCYWCFVVVSSGLLYLLLKYWGSSQTETRGSLLKMKHALKSYSEFTKAMIKAEDETALMEDVCRLCIEVGGHRMAWVAVAENDAQKSLKPVAHWGEKGCFFDNFHAS